MWKLLGIFAMLVLVHAISKQEQENLNKDSEQSINGENNGKGKS